MTSTNRELPTLWQLGEEYQKIRGQLIEAAEENDGVIPDELIEQFSESEGTLEEKGSRAAVVFLALEHHVAGLKTAAKEEIQRIRNVVSRAEREFKTFEQYIIRALENAGVDQAGSDVHAVKVSTNPPGVDDDATNIDEVPDAFCDVVVTIPADDYQYVLQAITVWMRSPEAEKDLRVHEWKATRKLRKKDIVDEWKRRHGAEQVPGTLVRQQRKVRVR